MTAKTKKTIGRDTRLLLIAQIIEAADSRAGLCSTGEELTDAELRRIYLLAKGKLTHAKIVGSADSSIATRRVSRRQA